MDLDNALNDEGAQGYEPCRMVRYGVLCGGHCVWGGYKELGYQVGN